MKRRTVKAMGKEGAPWGLLKTSWRFQTREFFDNSTLHGVRYIAEKGRPFSERFMWFCLTSIGTIVTLIIIVSLWEKFQTNPTITGLDTDFHSWNVPFPTVSLCSHDFTDDSLVSSYVKENWVNAVSSSDDNYYFSFVKTIARLTISNLESILPFTKPNDTRNNYLSSTNFGKILRKVTRKCPTLLSDCDFKGDPINCCGSEWFSPVLTEVGFCNTFNSRFSSEGSEDLRIIIKNGEEFKLKLIFETDLNWSIRFTMKDISETSDNGQVFSILVYIHSADELPSLDMVAQHNWTGDIKKIEFSVKYTYSTEEVQSLSINQRHCVFPREIKLLSDTNYTYSMCMTECRMKRAKALCGCVPFFYKDFDDFPHCDLEGLECLAHSQKELLNLRESSCNYCELGCMNTVYEVTKLTDADGKDTDNNTILEIGFVSWPMMRYKREVLFGWVDLLVSFGGIAGLFLGFSLLSGVEIVYYFTMRACCMIYRDRSELRRLQYEYETQPRPHIDLDLKPYFNRNVTPTKQIQVSEKEIFNIPFLN